MSPQQEISILLACPKIMDRELYEQALNSHAGFRVAGCPTSLDEILRTVISTPVDVALVTTALKDGPLSGLDALQALKEAQPGAKSVVLFERTESQIIVNAFRLGAKGAFCPAMEGFRMLCRCVEQVHAGQIWASSAQLQEILDIFSRRAPLRVINSDGAQLLTRREMDIVRLVEEGCTNRQIALELNLSGHTVRNNLFRIFDKLGVSNRVELALYAINSSKITAADRYKPGTLELMQSSMNSATA